MLDSTRTRALSDVFPASTKRVGQRTQRTPDRIGKTTCLTLLFGNCPGLTFAGFLRILLKLLFALEDTGHGSRLQSDSGRCKDNGIPTPNPPTSHALFYELT